MSKFIRVGPVADSVPFDKDNDPDCEFVSDTVQEVIEELCNRISNSASPGFTWGRSGNVNNNSWLLNDSVPSNKAGRTVALVDPEITQIFVANEDINTFDIGIYEHEGDEINLTLLGTVNVVAGRSATFSVSFTVTSGRQLATRVTSGSAKNLVIGCQIRGST